MSFWSFTAAHAADLLVPSSYATIQDAVDACGPTDRVVLGSGAFSDSFEVTSPVTVVGAGMDLTTLEGNGRRIDVGPGGALTLQGVTVTNGRSGNCVDVHTGTLTLDGVRLQDCGASGVNGGAVHADTGSTVTLLGCQLLDNEASRGAHVYFWGDLLTVVGTTFTGADGNLEGAVHVAGTVADASFTGCTFTQNHGGEDGGALSFDASDLVVDGSWFEGNSADGNGGALAAIGVDSVTLTGNSFVANTAQARAGAVDLAAIPTVELRRNTFCANAGGSAGAVRLATVGSMSLQQWSNNVFIANTGDNGGALYAFESAVQLVNHTFVDNRATTGGALFVTGSAGAIGLTNSIVTGSDRSGVHVGSGFLFSSSYTDWFDNTGGDIEASSIGPYDLTFDPGLQTAYVDCATAEPWPRLGSVLLDAGDPGILDVDGSTSELGAWGGPEPICVLAPSYVDADGDGAGADMAVSRDCAPPPGHSARGGDCDDNDVYESPLLVEVQDNGLDDDCDPATPDEIVTEHTGGAAGHTGGAATGETGGPAHSGGHTGEPLHTAGGAPTADPGCGCAGAPRSPAGLGLLAAVLTRRVGRSRESPSRARSA